MDTSLLQRKFARMGARLKLREDTRRPTPAPVGVRLDIGRDDGGEFFDIAIPQAQPAEVEVLDVQPAERHLLVLVREEGAKHKFLCGHDERHWFVAAIPETAPVGTVRQAKEALKPGEVLHRQSRAHLKAKAAGRRRNSVYVRQGEWFFVPAPGFRPDPSLVRRNEPLTRGNGGKPHWAEFCTRHGGQLVYVCDRHPGGLTYFEYRRCLKANPDARTWSWRTLSRNPDVYVRGRVRHADHKTIELVGWHKVLMNTEHKAVAMRNVAFLD